MAAAARRRGRRLGATVASRAAPVAPQRPARRTGALPERARRSRDGAPATATSPTRAGGGTKIRGRRQAPRSPRRARAGLPRAEAARPGAGTRVLRARSGRRSGLRASVFRRGRAGGSGAELAARRGRGARGRSRAFRRAPRRGARPRRAAARRRVPAPTAAGVAHRSAPARRDPARCRSALPARVGVVEMAGDAHVPDRFKSGVLRRLEVERHVRPARLEAVDASPERLLRILRADALEQSDDLLRLAPTRRRHPDLGRRTVEHVEIADDRLLLLYARVARQTCPASLEEVAKIPRFPAARLEGSWTAGMERTPERRRRGIRHLPARQVSRHGPRRIRLRAGP